MYSASHDWGIGGKPQVRAPALDEMTQECIKHRLSTCTYILGFCCKTRRVVLWV